MKQLAAAIITLSMLVMLGACAVQNSPAEPTTQPDERMASFMDNLDAVAAFLGTPGLAVAEDDISFYGDFVTARGYFNYQYNNLPVYLTFRHRADHEGETQWILLEYSVNWVRGPGFLDNSHWAWQHDNDERFDEAFTMRFYRHYDNFPEPIYSYVEEEISPEGWQAQVVDHMLAHSDIRLANLWFEEDRLVVDLTPAGAMPFNWGSLGSAMHGRSLLDSLFTLPGAAEIEVLVGGQRNIITSHFSFANVFRAN